MKRQVLNNRPDDGAVGSRAETGPCRSAKARNYLKEFFMDEQKTNGRVRINLSETAKGLWQIDCTAEFENVAESEKQLDAAVKAAKRVMAANNLKEVM
jgi:hypothetical protein